MAKFVKECLIPALLGIALGAFIICNLPFPA